MKWPKSVEGIRTASLRTLGADVSAGLTVGLVALPLAMAFGISSGVSPEAGLYTAIIAGFIISAFGGSRTQIGGPTGAFVVIVYGIVTKFGMNGLIICTMMAGLMLVALGLTGIGSAVRYIPRPVIVGFTNGIAVLIASTQIKDFLGLQIAEVPSDFVGRIQAILANLHTVSWPSVGLGAAALGVIVIAMVRLRRIPGTIIAMVAGTVAVTTLALPVETVGSRFGGVPSGLPPLTLPTFEWSMVGTLISPALTIALLGAIESLMSAVVADRMSGDKHEPNVELVAQGLANIAAPLFGGIPATGAIARTATNIRSGARTPVAGIVHALVLLAIALVAAPLAYNIPLSVLAAILFVVAYNMGEWREVPKLLRLPPTTIGVWATTFALTVLADLTVAVEVGLVLSALLYIRKVGGTTTVSRVTRRYVEEGHRHSLQGKHIPDYAAVIRVHGPFMFGTTEKLFAALGRVEDLPSILILRLRNMTALDSTGLLALEDLASLLKKSGRTLILCGAPEQPAGLMRQAEFARHVGAENICPDIQHALDRARAVHEMRRTDPPPTSRDSGAPL